MVVYCLVWGNACLGIVGPRVQGKLFICFMMCCINFVHCCLVSYVFLI